MCVIKWNIRYQFGDKDYNHDCNEDRVGCLFECSLSGINRLFPQPFDENILSSENILSDDTDVLAYISLLLFCINN